ncbi:MAG: fibronectin-binding domain-containing protein [Candidatus Syntrophoarchaeum sp. WYZ-LMO15]|nr:MAG: fibronectin-binding domain-containing protein [Candidatus Syntrophoarchaeum sp. WYZ-LMO15]
MKEAMSNPDIAAVVLELRSFIGARIDKSYQHGTNTIRIRFRSSYGKEGLRDLIIETGKRVHLTSYPPQSPKLPPSFPMFLRKHTKGARIVDVRQPHFDRILEIELERGGEHMVLLAELFDPGNLMLLDRDQRIMLPMRTMHFRDRVIKRGEVYHYPESGINPLAMDENELFELFKRSKRDLVRTIAVGLKIGSLYAEEVFLRCELDKNMQASTISHEEAAIIYRTINEIFDPIRKGDLKPHIVRRDDEMVDVLPFELVGYADETFRKEYFDSFNIALDEYYTRKALLEGSGRVETVTDRRLSRIERIMRQQEEAVSRFREEEELCIKKGEMIYANYGLIDEILSAIRGAIEKGYSWQDISEIIESARSRGIESAMVIKGLDGSRKTVLIELDGVELELDIRLTLEQNAKLYYDRSKVLRSKRNGAMRALEETRLRLKRGGEEEVEDVVDTKVPQRRVRQKKHWYDRFRWFKTSNGFLVLGGRDAKGNEELVRRYLEKGDLFFHTAYPAAPVVILKLGGDKPSDTDIEEASQFAVSFSSLWKDGFAAGDCYWVRHDQVSKTPEHGEYLPTGAFVIRGERNFRKNTPLLCSIGIEISDETQLIAGPPSAVKKWCRYVVEIRPGKIGHNEIARMIHARFLEIADLEDKRIVREVAHPSKIAHVLPPGGSELVG